MKTEHPITPPPERQPTFAELLMPIPKAQVESQSSGNHSITPSPELIAKWASHAVEAANCSADVTVSVATQAARWGADQELEACCEWLDMGCYQCSVALRAHRRPNPPSLKDEALAELELLRGDANAHGLGFDAPAIRRALEALPDV